YAPEREAFVAEAPAYVVDGVLDFSGLVDLTATRTSVLREEIESPDLLSVDLDDQPVHLERMVRLVRDYDEVCERSGLPKPRLQLELTAPDPAAEKPRFSAIKSSLLGSDRLPAERFLADLAQRDDAAGAPRISLRLVATPSP
ncbi:MAG TPA: hypothetical protein PLA50_19130, partial [Bacteroidia bacterium]|nr:hypothetical protein [Bacteroidia bacterium]